MVKLKVAGVHGVPASGVTAVVMNVTAVKPTTSGYVTVYPDGKPVPAVSNLNFTAGRTIPNLVIVPVHERHGGPAQRRRLGGSARRRHGLVLLRRVDVHPSGPVRLLDTRSGLGARTGTVGPGGIVSLQMGGVGRCAVLRGHGRGAQRDGDRRHGRKLLDRLPTRQAAASGVEPQLHHQ